MAFSADQAYLLNMLPYLSTQNVYEAREGMTVGQFVNTILESPKLQEGLSSEFQSREDIVHVLKRIQSDPSLTQLEFSHASQFEGGADRFVLTTPQGAASKEAIIIFEGTTGGIEWRDDAYGGGPTDQADGVSTEVQVNTQKWYKSAEIQQILSDCDHITVSGHSKGGNKAKYLTVLNDDIDSCISFDGQGFSDEFMAKYRDAIARRQGAIVNYSNADDYVNILLNDIGERHYIQGTEQDNFLNNHSLFTLAWSSSLSAAETTQNPVMAELDLILNGYLRKLSPKEKQLFMKILGEALADMLAQDEVDVGQYMQWLIWEKGLGLVTDFIKYAAASATSRAVLELLERLTRSIPFLHDAVVKIIEKWDKSRGDVKYANAADRETFSARLGTSRIAVDTEALERVSAQLSRVADELQSLTQRLSAVAEECDSFHIGFQLSVSLRLRLAGVASGLCIGTPGHVLRHMHKDVARLRTAVDTLSRSTGKAAGSFEELEQRNIRRVPASAGEGSSFS